MTKTQSKKDRERRERERRARDQRDQQVVDNFEATYGRDETKLEMWQRLCRDLNVEEGSSITKCKKELKGIYINIVDFVADIQAGVLPRTHRSYKALKRYMENNQGKIFPIRKAKDSPILKWMLIDVF